MAGSRLAPRRHRRRSALLAAFAGERSGIAAVEFALILPVLLILLYAGIELVNAVDHQRKVSQLARTMADLTSQGDTQNPISSTLMQDVLASAKSILAPYSTTSVTVQISAIGIYTGKITKPYVCSAWASGTTARPIDYATDLTVPLNYQRAGARYVVAEVKMPYAPILGAVAPRFVKGLAVNFNWSEIVSWPVRGGQSYSSASDLEVVLPAGKTCP